MRLASWVVLSLLVASALWGQAAPAPSPTPVSQPNSVAQRPGLPDESMSLAELRSWRMARMMRLTAEPSVMRSKWDKMSANAAKVKDPTLKQQLQLDNELWAMMLSQLELMTAAPPQSHPPNRAGASQQRYRQRQTLPPAASPAPSATPEAKSGATPDHP